MLRGVPKLAHCQIQKQICAVILRVKWQAYTCWVVFIFLQTGTALHLGMNLLGPNYLIHNFKI
jgi:hypothetical protein